MKLLSRAAALLAAALLSTGLVAVAQPAAAVPPPEPVTVSGAASCDKATGTWVTTWTIANTTKDVAILGKVRTSAGPVPGLQNGLVIRPGTATFTQVLPGDSDGASLSFTATGSFGEVGVEEKVTFPSVCSKGPQCVEAADATFIHDFSVDGKRAQARVRLDDGQRLCADEEVTLVSYYAPKPEFATPQYVFDQETAKITNATPKVELAIDVPACDTQVDLFFGGAKDVLPVINDDSILYGDRKLGSRTGLGGRSKGPKGWYNGGTTGCRQPMLEPVMKCDGTIDLKLSNVGEHSRYPVEFTIEAGDFNKTVTVQPGKSETVTVPAGAGPAAVTADGLGTINVNWAPPADCPRPAITVRYDCSQVEVTVTNPEGVTTADAEVTYGTESKPLSVPAGESATTTFVRSTADEVTVAVKGQEPVTVPLRGIDCPGTPPTTPGATPPGATPPPGGAAGGSGGEGPTLPVTGAAAGGIAAGAAVLLALGVGVLLLVRRRRVTFKA